MEFLKHGQPGVRLTVKPLGEKPEDPASDAVDAMDEAIEKDRAGGKQRRVASIKETGEELPEEQWERFEAAHKEPRRKD